MCVFIETSVGDIVIDLFTKTCPKTTLNFIKLCKLNYYSSSVFHRIEKNFIAQTGDPFFNGGESVFSLLNQSTTKFFQDEFSHKLTHSKKGTVSMANIEPDTNASQFFITLKDDLDYLDEKYTIFGQVAEGFDTLEKINSALVDDTFRPFIDIVIKQVHILEDPFEDPIGMDKIKLAPTVPEKIRQTQDNFNETDHDTVGDRPSDKHAENILFVCKLNPATKESDLEILFSRFGSIKSCRVVRDEKKISKGFAFIEFVNEEGCVKAFQKMDGYSVDGRKIKVDFSHSGTLKRPRT